MSALINNAEDDLPLPDIRHAKDAQVVNILAIATLRQEKICQGLGQLSGL